MSLHKFAEQVAANGRGDDSLLVHMTPDEVRNLQRFAEANGTTLTINPATGLPEAGLLSDLFKTVAPIALGAFLGPGAFGIAGMGLSAGTAGLITGGITSLATGSLSRGLMAGLGAYGGAGLAQGFADAGAGAGLSEALAGSSTGTGSQIFGDVAAAPSSSGQAFNEFLKSNANPATMSASELASSGLKAAASDPMAFAKQNFGNLAAAAAPIMAGAMVPTTTKMPENTNPAYIRQKLYDPYTQTYKSLAPVKASEWGNRSFSDAYTNPQTGQMATLDVRKPTGMAGGGITSLAGGGQPSMAEWLDKAGISQEAREKGSPELYTAINAYNALGSSLDPYRQKDTRDWAAVMSAENPTDALIQQNLPLYGGVGHVELTDTGGRLVSGAGDNLTSDLSRYKEFGIELNPTQIKNTLGSMQTDTPMNRARYNRINSLYEEAVRQAQEGARSMAGGGIVALAGGGVTDQQIKDWFATNQGASDTDIYNAMKQYNVGTEQLTNAMGFDPTEVGRRYDVQARNDIFSPTRSRSEQESMVNQYYQDQGIPADRLSQTNFGYPVDTRESRLESAPYTNLYEKYQQDLAATGRYDAPSDAQYRAQAVYMPDSIGNRGSIQLIDSATGQQLTNFGANDIGNTRNAFELLDKFGVDPTSYRNAATQMYESLGKPTYMQDDYAYLTGYKPRDVTGKTDTYLTKPLTNVTMADLKPKYEKDDNARQTADSKTNVFWMRPMQQLLMSKGMGASEATNYLHQLTPVSGLVNWAEISESKDPVKAIIGTLNYLQSKGLTNRRFASGGLASLADNIPGYAPGGYVPSDTDIFNYFKTSGLSDAQIAADMQKYNVTAADIARATGTQNQQGDYESRFVKAINTPTTSAQEFQAMTSDVGLQNQALENAMDAAGMSQAAQYAATHNLTDTKAPQTDFYNQFGYKTGALPGDQGGLEGYYANINYSAQGLQGLIDAGKMTGQQAREAALTEMNRIGMNAADLKAATGKTLAQLFPDTKVVTPITKITGTGGTGGTTVIPGGFYGNATNPGDITTNKDGTVTVHPNIPYRPDGGFSGVGEVRDAYTKGGGSLGYTSRVPKDINEFNQLYNKQTGDSLAAYNYLMGKGAGTADAAKYPIQSVAAATGINRPYWSEGMRYKPKFLSYDSSGNTVSSTTSSKPSDAKAADLTKAKTIEVIDSSGETTQTYTAVLQEDGTYLAGNGKRYDVTGKELAAGGGMMGYAVGGGLGSLGSYSDGGRLLKGPGDGVSDSIPATIGAKRQPARLADGEFVIPARIVSELGNGSTDAGAKKLYAMMDRVQKARGKTTGKNKVAANSRADKYLPA